MITGYVNSTKVVTVDYAWVTTPDATSVYTIIFDNALVLNSSLAVTFANTSIATVTTVTNQLTAAAIATGVWQDTTSGDFTTASSIGKSLYTSGAVPGATGGLFIAGTNAATSITTGLTAHIIGTVDTVTTVTNQLTAAAIATGVWTDTTAGDFTTATSPGKIIFTQLGGAFTSTSSSVFSTASLVNAPTGGSAPTTAQIATAVWQDLTSSGDFGTAGSIGALLKADINAPIGSIPTNPYTGTPPTTAQIATAIWEDTTAGGDFGTTGSIGKLIVTTGLTVATVTNAVTLPSIPSNWITAAGITASALNGKGDWMVSYTQPTGFLATTFPTTVASPTNITAGTITTTTNLTNLPSIPTNWLTGTGIDTTAVTKIQSGLSTLTQTQVTGGAYNVQSASCVLGDARIANLDAAVSSRSTYAGGAVASVTGAVGSVTAAVSLNLAQTGLTPRALDAVADASLTLGDALVCAISAATGKESVVGTAYTIKTPSTGTVIRTFTLDSGSAPTQRN